MDRRISISGITPIASNNLVAKSMNERLPLINRNSMSIETRNSTVKPMVRRISLADLSTTVAESNSFNPKSLSRRKSTVDLNTTGAASNTITPLLTIRRVSSQKPSNKLVSAVFTNAAATAFNNLVGKRTNIPISTSLIATTRTARSIINGKDENSRKNTRIVQNYLLVWFDADINERDDHYQHIFKSLERIVNAIIIFTDAPRCIEYITSITNEKVFMVISGTMGESDIVRMHDMPQLDSIYIFHRGYISEEEHWTRKWFKVKTVSTHMLTICDLLKKDTRQCDEDMISVSFVSAYVDTMDDNFDRVDRSFYYTQLLKEILLDTNDIHPESAQELAAYCHTFCVDNYEELKIISKFAHEYSLRRPLWWFKHSHFLHSLINRALRNLEIGTLFKIRFFVRDINQDIEHTHLEQANGHIARFLTIYRGQSLSKLDLDKLVSMKGGLISFNNFFFASQNEDKSMDIARQAVQSSQSIGILFVITIETSASFCILNRTDPYSESEQEILLPLGSVFRIGDINQIDDNVQIWKAELALVKNDDVQLGSIINSIRKIVQSNTDWHRLSQLLIQVGEFDKSEEVYIALINQTSDDSKKADLYEQVALLRKHRGDYTRAISFYDKALVIRQRILPSNHSSLMLSFKGIGEIYKSMNQYSNAVWYYEKAFEIEQEIRSSDHSLFSIICDTIASLYAQLSDYSKALTFYAKALEFRQNDVPVNPADVATSFKNIGSVYCTLRDYSKAMSFYEQALEVYENNLPSHHRDLAVLYNNIGTVYYNMSKYSQMLTFYRKALEINEKVVPQNHLLLATSYRNIGLAYQSLNKYSNALSYYSKALDIQKTVLSPKHSSLVELYDSIGSAYDNMNQYNKALEFYEKALEIRKEKLPSNDPQLAQSFSHIGSVYYDMGDYATALSFHERAVEVGQLALPSTHSDLDLYFKCLKMTKQRLKLLEK